MQGDHREGVRTRTRAVAISATGATRKYDHPAVITCPDQIYYAFLRVLTFSVGLALMGFFLGGCSVVEHRDGGGYTVRYAATSLTEPEYVPPPKRHYHKAKSPSTVAVVRERAESHPVLNIGKDDEIPREYANYVSDRGVRTWRQRRKMCAEARPAYCSAPNVPHCHGPFCHAHVGGDKRHTH